MTIYGVCNSFQYFLQNLQPGIECVIYNAISRTKSCILITFSGTVEENELGEAKERLLLGWRGEGEVVMGVILRRKRGCYGCEFCPTL